MTNKSYNKKVYYSFIKSDYQHDITVACFNGKDVRRNWNRTVTDFYVPATRSTELFNVDPVNFHVPALHITVP